MNLDKYTKQELIQLLGLAIEKGFDLPEGGAGTGVDTRAFRGRPSNEEQRDIWNRAAVVLAAAYADGGERQMVTDLAQQAGLNYAQMHRLHNNRRFLTTLTPEVRYYFRNLFKTPPARMPNSWRAILDIHNYILMAEFPGVGLPLYTWHALAWPDLKADPQRIAQRNLTERQRAAWTAMDIASPLPKLSRTLGTTDALIGGCSEGCPVVSALLDLKTPPTIYEARWVVDLYPSTSAVDIWRKTNEHVLLEDNDPADMVREIVGCV